MRLPESLGMWLLSLAIHTPAGYSHSRLWMQICFKSRRFLLSPNFWKLMTLLADWPLMKTEHSLMSFLPFLNYNTSFVSLSAQCVVHPWQTYLWLTTLWPSPFFAWKGTSARYSRNNKGISSTNRCNSLLYMWLANVMGSLSHREPPSKMHIKSFSLPSAIQNHWNGV